MEATEENPATTESFGLLETDSRPAQPTIVSNLNIQLQSSTNSLGGKSKRWRSICCWLSSTFGCAICVLLAAILIRAWTVKEIFVRNVIDPNPSMITVTRFGRQLDNHVDFQRTGKALSTLSEAAQLLSRWWISISRLVWPRHEKRLIIKLDLKLNFTWNT